jgi:tRNA (cmo5U34)-methyltransferase
MNEWTEGDSSIFREIGDVAVPRRDEMMRTLVAAVPFGRAEPIKIVELGSGEGHLAAMLLETFAAATITALDGSESMRERTSARLGAFGNRARVRSFDVASLDWWDQMFGADVVVSSLCLHHLNDAKKRYFYKAAADRLSPRGALLIADLIEPMAPSTRQIAADEWDASARAQAGARSRPDLAARFEQARWNHFRFPDPTDHPAALFHHLVWLRHAGFAAVDCVWMYAGHAVFGGFKQSAASESPPPADS